jgi:predicted ATPase/DNA-binding winged helix-turn-helix (wHTH) protein
MTEPAAAHAGATVVFGPFRLVPAQHLLLEDGQQVALGARALTVLVVLVERAGQIVSKDDLVARVWPETIVEEGNLRVQIASVRRALRDGEAGSRYIATIAGRGYSFVAPVTVLEASAADTPHSAAPEPSSLLSPSLTRIIGRTDVINTVCHQVQSRRFVTLVGSGGIGKTTVALAAAQSLSAAYANGVTLVDFSRVGDPRFVAQTLATALGLAGPSETAIPYVVGFLKDKEMLLVLDSCEHVIETAALLAEDLYRLAPRVHILATSREPLRVVGERVHRLSALESPSASTRLTAAEALTFPAVQLFVERAVASTGDFELSDADAPFVGEICRKLDGIALAIELAAGRVTVFSIRELARRLDDRLQILTSGWRTALPRHQTLLATLEWSYLLLPEPEQSLLCRLAVFVGPFTLESAVAVAADRDPSDVLGAVADLAMKSLVVVDSGGEVTRYRLLDTTRLFGIQKLREGGEVQQTFRGLSEYLRDYFARAEAEAETSPTGAWLKKYGAHADDIRPALEWAMSEQGDAEVGLALTIAAVPLWVQLSRVGECREWVERALLRIGDGPVGSPRQRMQLSAALGWSLMFTVGRARETRAAWNTTLALAESLGDSGYRLRALWGLWVDRLNCGEFRVALDLAVQFTSLVDGSTDAIDLMMADRMVGTSLHYTGDQRGARLHIERMLEHYASLAGRPLGARFQFDQRITAQYFRARIIWLQGYPEQAVRAIESLIEDARPLGNMLSFASVLGQGACPLALFTGDLAAAARYGTMLRDHADTFGLRLWSGWARSYLGLVTARQGDPAAGIGSMQTELAAAGDATALPRYLMLIAEFAGVLGQAGDVAAGLDVIDQAIARCARNHEQWYEPELLRIQGELILLSGAADAAAAAESAFLRALALAHQQEARSLALRAAISLARAQISQGRVAEARQHLAQAYGWFSEGLETADLTAARQILLELA